MSFARRILYPLATSDLLEYLVRRVPWVERAAYRQAESFTGGRTLAEAMKVVKVLAGAGFDLSLDFFGEGLDDPADAAGLVAEYRRAAHEMATVARGVDLEMVPSHLGLDLSVDFFCEHARAVAAALPPDARLQLSAEEISWPTVFRCGSMSLTATTGSGIG
jgi:proline dehydrogenase